MMATSNFHSGRMPPNASSNNRKNPIKPAAFTTVAMKEVNTVGEPSYTSDVQKWNGAADTLNDMENIIQDHSSLNIGGRNQEKINRRKACNTSEKQCKTV